MSSAAEQALSPLSVDAWYSTTRLHRLQLELELPLVVSFVLLVSLFEPLQQRFTRFQQSCHLIWTAG